MFDNMIENKIHNEDVIMQSDLDLSFDNLSEGFIDFILNQKYKNNEVILTWKLTDCNIKEKFSSLIRQKIDACAFRNFSANIKKPLTIEQIIIKKDKDNYQIKIFNDEIDYNINITKIKTIQLKLDSSLDIIFCFKNGGIDIEYMKDRSHYFNNIHTPKTFCKKYKETNIDNFMNTYLSKTFQENSFSQKIKKIMIQMIKLKNVIVILERENIINELLNINLLNVEEDFFNSFNLKYDFDIQKVIEDLNI